MSKYKAVAKHIGAVIGAIILGIVGGIALAALLDHFVRKKDES